jgi:quercetin dioxygenase-like cupin family protein
MTWTHILLALGSCAIAFAQSSTQPILTNLATARWTHDKGDPPGTESVLLRDDSKTGGMELLVRFPAGHVFKPHWHESNERIIVLEGQLTVGETTLDTGGVAFLPAKDVQHLSCTSKTRCTFYLSWDGNPKSNPAK